MPSRTEITVGVLECALAVSRGWAGRIVGTAISLAEDCPDTLAALSDGLIDDATTRMVTETVALMEDRSKRTAAQAR